LRRACGLDNDDGVQSLTFDRVVDHNEFKNAYRNRLDELPWDLAEQERVVAEVVLAHEFNTEFNTEILAELESASPRLVPVRVVTPLIEWSCPPCGLVSLPVEWLDDVGHGRDVGSA
jgi:heme oxygenase